MLTIGRGQHGSTYGGNPVAARVGIAALQVGHTRLGTHEWVRMDQPAVSCRQTALVEPCCVPRTRCPTPTYPPTPQTHTQTHILLACTHPN